MSKPATKANVVSLEAHRAAAAVAPVAVADTEHVDEMKWAWLRVREPRDADDFYAASRTLIERAHELDADELAELAAAIPLKRRKGRVVDESRRRRVWFRCLCKGNLRTYGKAGDPLMPKREALDWLHSEYGMKLDAARKLYDDVRRRGP